MQTVLTPEQPKTVQRPLARAPQPPDPRGRRGRGRGTARWFVVAALIAAVIGVGALIVLALARPRVIVTEAVEGPVVAAFYSTGTIQPEREYPIKSNTAGLLKEVRVDKGARVKKGDVLAVVEDPALTFARQEAQAMLEEKLQRIDAKLSPVLQEYDSKIAAMNDLLDIAK